VADIGRKLSTPRWYALVVIVVSIMALAIAGVLYTNYAIARQDKIERENDRRWCELLVTLDEAYQGNPPQSETGRAVARTIHDLRNALGCG
jgi:hypothetical protein